MKTAVSTTVDCLSNANKPAYLPWLVCFTAAFFFFFEFMQVNMFNAIAPSLMKEFSLSAARVGQISANYFYANLLFLFPAGMILDRFSIRKVVIFAMGSSIICAYLFASTHSVLIAEICRFITGIGGSFCFISCIRLVTNWFPAKRLALVLGLVVTFAMFGGMLAQTPMTLLTDLWGWRKMMFFNASMGVLMLGLIFAFLQDHPIQDQSKSESVSLHSKAFFQALRESLLNLQNWLGGVYTSLLNLPIILLGAMWGSLYLVQVHHLTRAQSSWVTSMIFIGTIIGSPVVGWISDRIGLRRLPMVLCATLALITILVIMFVPSLSLLHLMLLFFAIGLFTSAQIISYPLIAESNPRAIIGTAEGLASTLIMAGGIFQPVFGVLIALGGNHQLQQGLPLYSKNDFLLAMSILPSAFIISLIVSLFVKETYCKSL
jgi:MFS family permease